MLNLFSFQHSDSDIATPAPFYGSRIKLSDPFASLFCHIASKSVSTRRFGLIGLDQSQYIQTEAPLFFSPAVHALSLFSPGSRCSKCDV